MSDILRHGTIVLDIKTGKVEIKTPDLANALNIQRNQVELQEKQNTVAKEAVKVTKEHTEHIHHHARALREAGEGAFLVARGIALMTAGSDEDLQKMIRNLAAVHAGFDLFRGSTKVIEGLSLALGVSRAATLAILSTLTPYLAGVAALAGAYALWTNHTREQAKAEEELQNQIAETQKRRKEAADAALASASGRADALALSGASPQDREAMLRQRLEAAEFARQKIAELGPGIQGASNYDAARRDQFKADLLEAQNEVNQLRQDLAEAHKEVLEEGKETERKIGDFIKGIGDLFSMQGRQNSLFEGALQAIKRQ